MRILNLIAGLASIAILAGCTGTHGVAPNCSAETTIYAVERRVFETLMRFREQAYGRKAPTDVRFSPKDGVLLVEDTLQEGQGATLALQDVQTTGRDEELGRWECAAEVVFQDLGQTRPTRRPVTYTSALSDDGNHVVTGTIGDLRF